MANKFFQMFQESSGILSSRRVALLSNTPIVASLAIALCVVLIYLKQYSLAVSVFKYYIIYNIALVGTVGVDAIKEAFNKFKP